MTYDVGEDSKRLGERCLVSENFVSPETTRGEGGSVICEGESGTVDMLPALLDLRGCGVLLTPRFEPKLDKRTALKPANSLCLLKASKSGFWSTGIARGEVAALDRTVEVGGLQFVLAC